MGLPSKSEILKQLKKLEKKSGTMAFSPNASPLDRFRFDLCQKFIKYKREHDLNQKQLAEVLLVDEAKISKILRHRIEEFSTDRLIDLYSILEPDVKLKVG
ncbi:MAG: XRE family transcriptional regulator [Bacteriovoracaceae bacterium]